MMKYIKLCLILLCLFAPFYIGVDTVYAYDNTITEDDNVYFFTFQEPVVDSKSMYIVFLLEKIDTGARVPILQYFNITPRYTTDSNDFDWVDDVFFSLYLGSQSATVYMNVSSTTVARGFSCRLWQSGVLGTLYNDTFTTQASVSIDFSTLGNFKCVGYEIIGSHYTIESGLATRETFTYMFSDEYTIYNSILDIVQEISLNNELTADQLDLLGSILEELQLHGVTIDSLLSVMRDLELNTDQLDYYLDLIYNNVNNIYNKTDDVEYYLDLLYKQLNQVYNNTDDVEELLQALIDLWTPVEDESKYPEVDTSKQDQYVEIGKDLTSKDTTSQESELKIDVNANSGAYVWNLFNSFVSSNEKIIGMYITLLSCAFIALLLNR